MNNPDYFTVKTYYIKNLSDYMAAIDFITDLYDSPIKSSVAELTNAQIKLDRAKEKLESCVKIARIKYLITFDTVAPFLYKGGAA